MRLTDCPVPDSSGNPQAFGCTANIEMQTLERFLWKALRPDAGMRLLDVFALQQVICALLDFQLLKGDIYNTIRAYLGEPNECVPDPLKRVQLASKIARQFQEYEFNRPSVRDAAGKGWKRKGIDSCWLDGKPYGTFSETQSGEQSDEAWQMDLYCRAQKCLKHGFTDTTGQHVDLISLPHLHRLRCEKGAGDNDVWTVPACGIFLFQVSKISHFHRNTLVEISQMPGVEMHVLLTNPCAEFWEDVDTWRNHKSRRIWKHDSGCTESGVTPRKPEDYHKSELSEFVILPGDHALLELWGNAGKENIYLWCPQAEWNFEYYNPDWIESDTPPETLLRNLQRSLLRRENSPLRRADGSAWTSDGSLQVLASPDPSREVEELREQILDLVEQNKIEKLDEIAVYLPDPGAYQAQIQRVFGAYRKDNPGYIPFTVLGAPGSDSLFAQGIQVLFKLAEGRFDRAGVFSLLRNPFIQSTLKVSPENVTIWERWAEELGIFRGFDKEHRRKMGDKGQMLTDAHTFGFGIARLLIGNLAEGPVDLKYQLDPDESADGACTGNSTSQVPVYRDFETSDADLVDKFCCVVERLYQDIHKMIDTINNGSLSGAVDAMIGLVTGLFGEIPDGNTWNAVGEGRIRQEFLDALPTIKMQSFPANRKDPVTVREFIALANECLLQEIPSCSAAWTGGITFAPLRPSMVVPHKVIFVLGLDALAFPGTGSRATWDLLSKKRIVGDSDPVRDNRFAFLELLHAARQRLILSFRARNMQKEEELQPSSVILELESFLKSQGLTLEIKDSNEHRCLIRRKIPWVVRESLQSLSDMGRFRGSWDPAEVRLAHLAGFPKARYRYPTDGLAQAATQDPLRTNIFHLRKFFSNPLEYHLSKTLGAESDELPATMSATDEPLKSGALAISGLQKSVWMELLLLIFPESKDNEITDTGVLRDRAANIAAGIYGNFFAEGKTPEAQFSQMEKRNLIAWAKNCAEASLDLRKTFFNHRLLSGADLSLELPGVSGELTVIMNDGRICAVECRHNFILVPRHWNSQGTSVGILNIRKKGKARDNPDLWLTGVVQWLALRRYSRRESIDIRLIQLNRGDEKERVAFDSAAMKHECGKDLDGWLKSQISAMVLEHCADHFPFAVVQELTGQNRDGSRDWKQRWSNVTKENIEEKLADTEHGSYICYLESLRLVEARIPDIEDDKLCELAQARFGPMLEGWVHE
jgi:exonuclease V gamma subunit